MVTILLLLTIYLAEGCRIMFLWVWRTCFRISYRKDIEDTYFLSLCFSDYVLITYFFFWKISLPVTLFFVVRCFSFNTVKIPCHSSYSVFSCENFAAKKKSRICWEYLILFLLFPKEHSFLCFHIFEALEYIHIIK